MNKIIKGLLIICILLISVGCSEKNFYLVGDKEVILEVHTPYNDPGIYTKSEIPVKTTGVLDIDHVGTYTLTYTTVLNSKEKNLTRLIRVVDTTAPVITLKGSQKPILCPNQSYQEEGFTALDNNDGDLSALVKITEIPNGLSYSILDSSSNITEIKRTYVIQDTVSPILTLNGYAKIMLRQNSEYTEFGVTASDNCEDVSKNITITNNINPSVLGTYTVTYSVSDKAGNTSTLTREVEVTNKGKTTVFLTFDDGPSYRTPEVLDILKEYGVKATFFVLKRDTEYDPILRRAVKEGHVVAIHGYSHQAATIYASSDAFFENLTLAQNWLEGVTGVKSYLYRFPGGSSNLSSSFNPGIMTTLSKMVPERGFHYFDWNVSSGDGNANTTSAQMIKYVTTNCLPDRYNVVLMHDSEGHQNTVAALRPILDYLKSIDAEILPITMETPQIHHGILN